jgi:hypothetical protein
MGLGHSPTIITDGLVYAIDPANSRSYTGSGITVNGLASFGSGTLVNGVGFTSTNGGSFVFDGTNDYIDFGTSFLTNQSYSLEFVFKTTTTNVSVMAGKYNGGTDWWAGIWSSYKFLFSSNILPSASINISTSMNVNDGVIRNIVATCDANTYIIRLYVNGVLNATGNGTTSPQDPGGIFTFSKFGSVYEYYFNGTLYNFKVYQKALSATEVKQNYNATKKRYGL